MGGAPLRPRRGAPWDREQHVRRADRIDGGAWRRSDRAGPDGCLPPDLGDLSSLTPRPDYTIERGLRSSHFTSLLIAAGLNNRHVPVGMSRAMKMSPSQGSSLSLAPVSCSSTAR